MPLLKPAARHSASVSRTVAAAPGSDGSGPERGPRRGLGIATAVGRALLLQLAAFGIVLGCVAAAGRLPGLPPGLLPFPGLSGNERALLALTVLPHAALALLVLLASRLRPGTGLGFAHPALPRRALLLMLLWPAAQLAWTAGLLLLAGQPPARAWRLSPFLTGSVFWAWALWLVVLAPLAVGGTQIARWAEGDLAPLAQQALAFLQARYRVTHAIWHQGENDQGADGPTGGYGYENYRQSYPSLQVAKD